MTERTPLRADVAAFAKLTGWEYFPIAFLGRLPFAMMIVGVLTIVATVRDSVAEAGLAAAFAGVGTALCGPLVGSLADRISQRAVLLACSAVSILSTALFLLLVAGAPLPALLAVAFVAGGSTPQVSPFSRSRLVVFAGTVRSTEKRGRAVSMVMSYESVVDEASFVLGPVLVGILTTFIAPWAPLVVGAVITATVVAAFALHPSGRAVVAAHTTLPGGQTASVFSPRILVLAGGMLLVGAVFGSILTALTEFMKARGLGEQTGIAYGSMSVGAILVAVSVAALPARFTLAARWVTFAVIGLAGVVVLAVASDITMAVIALFLSGIGIGAVLVALFSLGAQAAPVGRSTTVLTTLQSTLVVGQALATAVGGVVSQAHGAMAGFAITAAACVVLVAVAVIYRARFARS